MEDPSSTTHRPHQETEPFSEETEEHTVSISRSALSLNRSQAVLTLHVVAGMDLPRFVTIAAGQSVLVGRDEIAHLRLTDITVSKRHAQFDSTDGRSVEVIDLGSTNGTHLRGRRIDRAVIGPGDDLELGNVLARLDALPAEQVRHLARVVERLKSANRDPLTRLLTRAWLDNELDGLMGRCDHVGAPISCVFIDIDHFKGVNDAHGHQVGDEVLQSVARILMLMIRDGDPAIRYGGEELLVVLPGSGARHAWEVAERVRMEVGHHDWGRSAPGLSVTLSAGVAVRLPGESARAWLRRADEALYQAKHEGRDRVVLAT